MFKEFHELEGRIQRQNNLNQIFVCQDKDTIQNGVNHVYKVARYDDKLNPITETNITFQLGPRQSSDSLPGCIEGDLLEIVRHRLQAHQNTEYRTREGALALTAVEEALLWLAKRADDRAERGVLGTNNK